MTGARSCVVIAIAIATTVATCGFDAKPTSGVVACSPGGAGCCPDGYVCVGRGVSTASGPAAGTCWDKDDLPLSALASMHDDTPTVPNDAPCLVTDWPRDVGVGGVPGSGAAGANGTGGTGGVVDGGPLGPPNGTIPSVSGPIATSWISAFDPGTVYITGEFDHKDSVTGKVTTYQGLFDTTDFARFVAIMPKGTWGNIHPDGTLVYLGMPLSGPMVFVRQFVPDPDLTKDPMLNDPELELPTCPGDQVIDRWLTKVAPDTGDLLFECEYCPKDRSCRFPSETTISYCYQRSRACMEIPEVVAIGAGGRYLLRGRTIDDLGLRILNPDGSQIPVADAPRAPQAVRVSPTGFWLLEIQGIDDRYMSRWHVAYDGTVTEHVAYPPSPIPVQIYYRSKAIDGQGRAITSQKDTYLTDRSPKVGRTIILRFDPAASSAEVLLDMATPPSIISTLNVDPDAESHRFFTGP